MPHTDEAHPLLCVYNESDRNWLVTMRKGEIRLGEQVQLLRQAAPVAALSELEGRFVLLGIPEDIGVRANFGVGGTDTLWEPALRALLHMQERPSCSGSHIILLGAFDFSHWMAASEKMDAERMRAVVDNIDQVVFPIIEAIVKAAKIPIIIGGGHNNALPLLQGASYAKGYAINCINLDAHSDYRRIEGRHSGNPFRYARQDGFLERYAMVGLHRSYNSTAILEEIATNITLHCSFYEDIFLEEKFSFSDAISAAISHVEDRPTGIELDLDCITGVLSSAATPCGISALQARQYLRRCALGADVAYLHLPEGAVALHDGRRDAGTAKLVAYLISDFVASMYNRKNDAINK